MPSNPSPSHPHGFSQSAILDFEPVKITPQTPVMESVGQILLLQLQLVLKYKPVALEGKDPEGVHKVRVGLRRLRTALKLYKPYLKKDVYKSLSGKAKYLARELGALRDLDVLKIHFTNYANERCGAIDHQAEWEKAFHDHYANLSGIALSNLNSDEFDALAAAILQINTSPELIIVSANDWPDSSITVREILPPKINKIFTKIQSYRGKITNQAEYAPYHALRLEIKKFRYTLEFFSDLLNKNAVDEIIDLLVEIQDQLGYLNDAYSADKILTGFKLQSPNWSDCMIDYQEYRQEEYNRLKNNFTPLWETFNQKGTINLIQNKLTIPLS